MSKVRSYHCNCLGTERAVTKPKLTTRKIAGRVTHSENCPYCGKCFMSWSEALNEEARN